MDDDHPDYEEHDNEDYQNDQAPDWAPGTCDRCAMHPGQVGILGVCCACSIGQGASQDRCFCPWGEA